MVLAWFGSPPRPAMPRRVMLLSMLLLLSPSWFCDSGSAQLDGAPPSKIGKRPSGRPQAPGHPPASFRRKRIHQGSSPAL